MRTLVIAALIALLASPALAQMGGGGGKKGPPPQSKTDAPKKKPVDEKAYKSAIERLPDKPYDAWKNVRGQ
jgi:hypothetical protein